MNAQMSNQVVTSMTPAERRNQPLGNAVKVAMQKYFRQLDGHEPDELYNLVLTEVERPLLESVMDYCRGNQTKAAQCLGLNRGTLRKKLKQYDLV